MYMNAPSAQEMSKTAAQGLAPQFKDSPISAALQAIEQEIDSLEAAFSMHAKRIEPILGPDSPASPRVNQKEPEQSPLHSNLLHLVMRVSNLRELVNEVDARLTL